MFQVLSDEWLLLIEDPSFGVRTRRASSFQSSTTGAATTAAVSRFGSATDDEMDGIDFSLSSQVMIGVADYVGGRITFGASSRPGALALNLEVDPMEFVSSSPMLGALLLRPQASARTVLSPFSSSLLSVPLLWSLPTTLTSLDALCKSAEDAVRRWLRSQSDLLRDHYTSTPEVSIPYDPVSQYLLSQSYDEPWGPILVRPSYAPDVPSHLLRTPLLPETHTAVADGSAGGWMESTFVVIQVEYVATLLTQPRPTYTPPHSPTAHTGGGIVPTGKCILRDLVTRRSYKADLYSSGGFDVAVRRQDHNVGRDELVAACSSVLELTHWTPSTQWMNHYLTLGRVLRCLCLEVSYESFHNSSSSSDTTIPSSTTTQLVVFSISSQPGDNLSSNDAIEQVLAAASNQHQYHSTTPLPHTVTKSISTFDCWSHWRECNQQKQYDAISHASLLYSPLPSSHHCMSPTLDDHFVAVRQQWIRFASGGGGGGVHTIHPVPSTMGTMVGILLTCISSRLQVQSHHTTTTDGGNTCMSATCRPLTAAVVGRSLLLEQLLLYVLDPVVDSIEGPTGDAVPKATINLRNGSPKSLSPSSTSSPHLYHNNPQQPTTKAIFSVCSGPLSQGPAVVVHPLSEHLSHFPQTLASHYTHTLSRGVSSMAHMDVGNLLVPVLKRMTANLQPPGPKRGGRGAGVGGGRGGGWSKSQYQPHAPSPPLPDELTSITQFLRAKGLISHAGNALVPDAALSTSPQQQRLSVPFIRSHAAIYLAAVDQHITNRPPPTLSNIVGASKSTVGSPRDINGLLAHCDLLLPLTDVLIHQPPSSSSYNALSSDRRASSIDGFMEGIGGGIYSPKEFNPDAYAVLQHYYVSIRRESAMGNDTMALLVRLATSHAMLIREHTIQCHTGMHVSTPTAMGCAERDEGGKDAQKPTVVVRLSHDTVDMIDVIVAISICDLQCQIRNGCSVLTFPFFSEAMKDDFSCVEFQRDLSVYLQHCSSGT